MYYFVKKRVRLPYYASPVIYSVQIVPQKFLFWYYLNPMSGFLDVFRFAVTGQTTFSWLGFGWSSLCAIAMFSLGTWIFRSVEQGFADYI